MIINLNETLRLSSDKYQWMVQKRSAEKTEVERKKDGKTVKSMEYSWKSETFHMTIYQAINSVVKRAQRESDIEVNINNIESIRDAIHRIEVITMSLVQSLDDQWSLVKKK